MPVYPKYIEQSAWLKWVHIIIDNIMSRIGSKSKATQALVLMDFHAHLSAYEVIGLLGGTWDAETRSIVIREAFPCRRAEARALDAVATTHQPAVLASRAGEVMYFAVQRKKASLDGQPSPENGAGRAQDSVLFLETGNNMLEDN